MFQLISKIMLLITLFLYGLNIIIVFNKIITKKCLFKNCNKEKLIVSIKHL